MYRTGRPPLSTFSLGTAEENAQKADFRFFQPRILTWTCTTHLPRR